MLRNAAGLILKLRKIVAVQDLKISFCTQILVPPPLLARAPPLRLLWQPPSHFVKDPTLDSSNLSCWYITHQRSGPQRENFSGGAKVDTRPPNLIGPPKPYWGPWR